MKYNDITYKFLIFIKKILAVNLAFILYLSYFSEANAMVVNNIQVIGNHKVNRESIIEHILIKPHKEFCNLDIDESVKNLFSLGFFSDVQIKEKNSRLLVIVKEYNLVNKIVIEGNKKIKTADILNALSLKSGTAFSQDKLSLDVKTIKSAYKSGGFDNVEVETKIIDAGTGSVNILFHIDEDKQFTVKNIKFVGNDIFSSTRLRSVINTKETGLLSWFTHNDAYSPQRLLIDQEALRNFYFTHGYADFRVISSKATINPARKGYDVVFTVDEGAKYKFGDIKIETSISAIDLAPLYKVLKTVKGQEYNSDKIDDSMVAINEQIAYTGYAFAKVEVHKDHNFGEHTISLIYSITQGPRLYVERIDIQGNNRTKDYVIRREFPFSEGDALNSTMLRRVKRRLQSLGFFESVDITTRPGSSADQVVIVANVSESSTGEFSIGGGYTTGGSAPGASFDASIAENNFLGRGQKLKLSASIGQDSSKNLAFSFTEPYFMGHKLPVGLDIFATTYRMNKAYDVKEVGASPRVDIALTDNLSANITYNYIKENYNLGNKSALEDLNKTYAGAIVKASQKSWLRSSLQYGLIYNSLDNMVMPRQGIYAKLIQEYAGLGGEANYFKTYTKFMSYNNLSDRYDIVALFMMGGGLIHETKENGARVFDLFKSDNNLVRGFKYNGIGPRQAAENNSVYFIGGSKYFNATAELQYPIPVVSESLGMRGAVFVDAGSVFDNPYKPTGEKEKPVTDNDMKLRASAGVSLIWASPLGPLRFDYAWPLKKEKGDLLESFNFGVSSKF